MVSGPAGNVLLILRLRSDKVEGRGTRDRMNGLHGLVASVACGCSGAVCKMEQKRWWGNLWASCLPIFLLGKAYGWAKMFASGNLLFCDAGPVVAWVCSLVGI